MLLVYIFCFEIESEQHLNPLQPAQTIRCSTRACFLMSSGEYISNSGTSSIVMISAIVGLSSLSIFFYRTSLLLFAGFLQPTDSSGVWDLYGLKLVDLLDNRLVDLWGSELSFFPLG